MGVDGIFIGNITKRTNVWKIAEFGVVNAKLYFPLLDLKR